MIGCKVMVFCVYVKYMCQIGSFFSCDYIVNILVNYLDIVCLFVDFFDQCFNFKKKCNEKKEEGIFEIIKEQLDNVSNLDDD